MSTYSIKDIEQLSGIKAHTIRIWEQRYNFIKPKRTDTNIRLYDDEDLKRILNVSLLNENGYKISRICKMSEDDIREEVGRIAAENKGEPEQIKTLTLAMLDLDEERFEKIISTSILQVGFEKTMLKIISPFFKKIGVLWQTNAITPAHEHFISNLIRQKIIVAIDGQPYSSSGFKNKFLLFLPEGELHEITLLFSAYIIKSRNNKVVYLGQSLPLKDVREVYETHRPQYILSVFTSHPQPDKVQAFIDNLSETFNDSTILLSGTQLLENNYLYPENTRLLSNLEELINFVEHSA